VGLSFGMKTPARARGFFVHHEAAAAVFAFADAEGYQNTDLGIEWE